MEARAGKTERERESGRRKRENGRCGNAVALKRRKRVSRTIEKRKNEQRETQERERGGEDGEGDREKRGQIRDGEMEGSGMTRNRKREIHVATAAESRCEGDEK